MHILILGPAYPFRGGLANFIERMALECVDQGHEVTIFTFTRQYPEILFPGKSQLSDDSPPENLRIRQVLHAYNPLNWPVTARKILQEDPDLIICKFWLPFMGMSFGSVFRLVKRKKDIPVIAIIDNIIPHEKRPGDTVLARYFCNTVDGFLVMSHAVGNDLRRFTRKQPVVHQVHPIYDNYGAIVSKSKAKEYLGLDESIHYLLFFGFIRAYKGLDLFIRLFARDEIASLPVKGIIAGEYYDKEEKYTALIDSLGVADKLVIRTEFISNEEVKYYFGAADIVVLPYKAATQSGITQIAYHFEKPMLVTNVGGLHELVEHEGNGYVVDPDVVQVSQALERFFRDKKESAFAERSRILKKTYSWEQFINVLFGLYDKLKSQ